MTTSKREDIPYISVPNIRAEHFSDYRSLAYVMNGEPLPWADNAVVACDQLMADIRATAVRAEQLVLDHINAGYPKGHSK